MLNACVGLSIERRCQFDLTAQRYYREAGPGDRVYVSTRGLGELLSREQFASRGINRVFSGGSTIEGSAIELANGCLRELNAVHAFLKDTAADEADHMLPEIAETIATGQAMKSPKVQIIPFQARVEYEVKPGGESELLWYLPKLKSEDASRGLRASASRPGFAVVVKNCPSEERPGNKFDSRIGKAKPLSRGVLKRMLPGETSRLFELALADESDESARSTSNECKMFEQMDFTQVKISPEERAIVDLRATAVGAEIERRISSLKIGHLGEARVSRLSLNALTSQVALVADLRAREKIALGEALKLVGKTTEDLNGQVTQSWKAAGTEVTKLRSELSETTRKLAQAANAESRAVGVLDFAQRDLDAARRQQADASRSLGVAVQAKNEAQRQVEMSSGRVKDAERNVIDLAKLMNQLPPPQLARRPRWRS